jgi:hypothetical protein
VFIKGPVIGRTQPFAVLGPVPLVATRPVVLAGRAIGRIVRIKGTPGGAGSDRVCSRRSAAGRHPHPGGLLAGALEDESGLSVRLGPNPFRLIDHLPEPFGRTDEGLHRLGPGVRQHVSGLLLHGLRLRFPHERTILHDPRR